MINRRLILAVIASLLLTASGAWVDSPPGAQDDIQRLYRQEKLIQIPDIEMQRKQFAFSDGFWMPEADPSRIGPTNFKTQRNWRPTTDGLRGVRGYSKINTTALTAYPYVRTGAQMRKDNQSYTFVHAQDGSGNGKVYLNRTEPPNAGDFETVAVYDDPKQNLTTYFAELPGGAMGWANQEESIIYSGDNLRVAALFTVNDTALSNPVDWTEALNSKLDNTGNTATIDGTGQRIAVLMSTRRLDGIDITVKTANTTATLGAVTVKCFDGSAWPLVNSLSDGTDVGGVPLKQSGTITFLSTADYAKPFHFEGLYVFAYIIEWPAETTGAVISRIQGRAPPQTLNNIWDGAYRQAIQGQVVQTSSNDNEEYTLEINEPSNAVSPIGMVLDALPTSKHIFLQFEHERQSAIKVTMLGGYTNENAAVMTLQYWNKSTGWTAVSNLVDGTADGGKSLAKSGLITWSPPEDTDETPKTDFGTSGFSYRISFSAALSGTAGSTPDVLIDLVYGVPAQIDVPSYNFLATFKGRVLGVGVTSEGQGHRVDYSLTNAPDVWNGEETSRNVLQSLYFGSDSEPLVAGMALYNRYASTVKEFFVLFKQSSMYQLRGSGPGAFDEDGWQIDEVSNTIGCPAPGTLVTVDGFEIGKSVFRRVMLWVNYNGVQIYDGANIVTLPGVSNYFDPAEPENINYDLIHLSVGWYDPIYEEYNIIIPSGADATGPNTWLVFSKKRQRWFEKWTGLAPYLTTGFQVRDANGVRHTYGGIDSGHIMRLEHTGTWDGVPITQTVETGDFWPDENIWNWTLIRAVKVVAQRVEEPTVVRVVYYRNSDPIAGAFHKFVDRADGSHAFINRADGSHSFVSGSTFLEFDISTGLERVVRSTKEPNLQAWMHGFGFSITTSTTEANLFFGWAIKWYYLRDDGNWSTE